MVEACQKLQNQGNMGLTIAFGSFSDFFLCAGFLPQFIMIWKDKEVIGFSYIFLLMDSAGAGTFSLPFGRMGLIDSISFFYRFTGS